MDVDLWRFAVSMFVLVVSLSVHEFAHAKAAYLAGDDTARHAGRVSLNPLVHLDPFGTLMMVMSSLAGFGIGWAKPVPVNPANFKHPRWDELRVSLWGPLSNLILALVAGQIMRFGWNYLGVTDLLILYLFVLINTALALFNLIPIAPLDGSHILSALLPVEQARRYDIFMMRYGFVLLLGIIFLGPMANIDVLGIVLERPSRMLVSIFTGTPL